MIGDRDSDGESFSGSSAVPPSADAPGGGVSGSPPRLLSCLSRFDAGRFVAAELMVLVAATACFARVQSDTYWHLASGRAMTLSGRVMLTDEFSHTIYGAPWANYEWLSQVVFYRVYSAGGMPLLTALCALLLFGSCVLTWKLIRGSIEDRVLLLALVLPLLAPGWSLRPQAFSMFLVVAVIHLVLRDRFWVLPPLFCLWANLHGAVALGLVVLLADLVTSVVSRRKWQRSAAFGLLSFGATSSDPSWTLLVARGVAFREPFAGQHDYRVDAAGLCSQVCILLVDGRQASCGWPPRAGEAWSGERIGPWWCCRSSCSCSPCVPRGTSCPSAWSSHRRSAVCCGAMMCSDAR